MDICVVKQTIIQEGNQGLLSRRLVIDAVAPVCGAFLTMNFLTPYKKISNVLSFVCFSAALMLQQHKHDHRRVPLLPGLS